MKCVYMYLLGILLRQPHKGIFYSILHYRFVAVNGGLVYLYCVLYQGVDQEEYGGAWELLKEGMMTAFAMFLVSILKHNTVTTS